MVTSGWEIFGKDFWMINGSDVHSGMYIVWFYYSTSCKERIGQDYYAINLKLLML